MYNYVLNNCVDIKNNKHGVYKTTVDTEKNLFGKNFIYLANDMIIIKYSYFQKSRTALETCTLKTIYKSHDKNSTTDFSPI